MNRTELEEALSEVLADLVPNWSLGEDNNGQIVIFTDLTEDLDTGEVVDFESDDDEDLDVDPDFEPLEEEDELE
jgi:hypothetical protein